MKQYTLKPQIRLTETDVPSGNTEVLLQKVQALKSGSEQSTKEFTNYIHDEYNISDGVSFGSIIKVLLKGAVAAGSGYGIIKMVGKAVEFGNNAIMGLPWAKTIDLTSRGIGKFTLFGGSLWWLVPCLLACYAIMILYKIFIWALKKPVKENYSKIDAKLIDMYSELMLKRSLIQSNKFLEQLKHITESTNLKEGNAQQAAALKGIVSKATPKCESMLDRIIHATQNFIHKYRRLIVVILICIGLVLSLKNLQNAAKNGDLIDKAKDLVKSKSGGIANGIGIGKGTIGVFDHSRKDIAVAFANKDGIIPQISNWLSTL